MELNPFHTSLFLFLPPPFFPVPLPCVCPCVQVRVCHHVFTARGPFLLFRASPSFHSCLSQRGCQFPSPLQAEPWDFHGGGTREGWLRGTKPPPLTVTKAVGTLAGQST